MHPFLKTCQPKAEAVSGSIQMDDT
jgi:hypothetical protein